MPLSYTLRKYLHSGMFLILSVFSLGISTGIFFYIYYFLQKAGISKAHSTVDQWSLAFAVISLLIALFSFIAPFINKKQKALRLATSIIYVIYDILLILAVIIIYKFPSTIGKVFQPIHYPEMCEFKGDHCCGWSSVTECTTSNNTYYNQTETCLDGIAKGRSCEAAVYEYIRPVIHPCAITFIAIIIILTLGSVFAFIISCRSGTDSDDGSKTRENMNTPLTYGW